MVNGMNYAQTERVRDLIIEAPLGQYIGNEGAQILAERAALEIRLSNDDFLYHRGDEANSFYIVTKGRIAIGRERDNRTMRIFHVLEKGDLLGELSFIDGTPRTVSAAALGDACVLCFDAEDIRPLVYEHPKLTFDFMRAVVKRVHRTVSAIGQQQMDLADYISSGGRGRL